MKTPAARPPLARCRQLAGPAGRGRGSLAVLSPLLLAPAAGCARPASPLVLASTTSTEDSGLFDVLLPAFEAAQPRFDVRLVAVGSGQARRLGEAGDADVLLVHSPAAEAEFMQADRGEARLAASWRSGATLAWAHRRRHGMPRWARAWARRWPSRGSAAPTCWRIARPT